MYEIICLRCVKAFKIDEAGYADILKQVRNAEFEKQLHERLNLAELEKRNAVELAAAKTAGELLKETASKDAESQELRCHISNEQVARKLAISETLSSVEKEGDKLQSSLEKVELEKKLAEKPLKDKYETQIRDRDDAIERLRDMKACLSTKMIGETLEQHCETEFNRIRSTAFILTITPLRNAALNSLRFKSELALIKEQNIDITNFESELETFKSAFANNHDLAAKGFQIAISEIDKLIEHLQKGGTFRNRPKPSFGEPQSTGCYDKKLNCGNPTMAVKLAELKVPY